MDQETFTAVDAFVGATLAPHDEPLQAALDAAVAAGLPEVQVSPPQGKLLQMLARMVEARTVLEFGTLGGYSTILLARALPDGGRLITLEANPDYAEVARGSIERAGVGDVVELRIGPALETLPLLEREGAGPFDLVFIDADKVIRGGTLAETASDDPATRAQRRLHETLAGEPRVTATTIQTVGSKGYDGFTIALVDGD